MNKIIVEGKNDKAFIDYLFTLPELTTDKTNTIITEIYTEQLIHGLSESDLIKALNETIRKFKQIKKLGIIIDMDNETVESRVKLINDAIHRVFGHENLIETIDQEYELVYNEDSILISCFLMNANGKGELMNVLREIKNRPSAVSDCMVSCLVKVPDTDAKEMDDDWVYYYIKWDNANKKERENSKNLKIDNLFNKNLKSEIWNFNHQVLNDLKTYLSKFKQ